MEDEPGVRALLREALEKAGFALDEAAGVEEAQGLLLAFPYDLLVLDLFLPDGDGLEVLRFARERGLGLPVLILTARDGPEDRVGGLEAGADDYLVKPFYPKEAVARVRALLRRSRGLAQNRVQVGRLELDLEGRLAFWEGQEVRLSGREFALLEALALAGEGYSSREHLLEKAWSGEESVDPRTVDTYIKYLRRKLAPEAIEDAAHALRTSLTLLLGELERGRLAEARTQVERLRELVERLLLLARAEAGTLERSPLALDGLVFEETEALRPAFRARDLRLEVELPEEPAWVLAHPAALRAAVVSLLENALEHTARGGWVRVRVDGEELLVENGPGRPRPGTGLGCGWPPA